MTMLKEVFLFFILLPLLLLSEHIVSVPEVTKASPGDTIFMPIELTLDPSAAISQIDAYGFKVDFPHQLLDFIETSETGTLTDGWIISQGTSVNDSTINVGGFNLTPITESGTLLFLTLVVKENVLGADSLRLHEFVDDLAGATAVNGLFSTPFPPVIENLQGQTVAEGESFASIQLDDYVTDPDTPDDQLTWSYAGTINLSIDIADRVATISTPHENWNGAEKVLFTVTDPDGLSDSAGLEFEVTPVNDAPVLQKIPDQNITQGEEFTPINLKEYVSDVDDPFENLQWSFTGMTNLVVTLLDSIVEITVQNMNWFGSETITFRVQDKAGLPAETQAIFSVEEKSAPIQGLVGHWTFDEGSGSVANDASEAGNHGEIINAAWEKGKIGSGALSFNGTSSVVNVPHSPSLEITDQLTLAAWIYVMDAISDQNVLQKEFIAIAEIRGGAFSNVLNFGGTIWSIFPYTVDAAALLGSWHHVAMTYDGAQVVNYLDGQIDTTFAQTGTIHPTTADIGIGANNPWQSAWFNGKIDDVRMYNVPLRLSEIHELYISKVEEKSVPLPTTLELAQNYPNPFNPTTTIQFSLPEADHVRLTVYDYLGHTVATLLNEQKQPGIYTVAFDAGDCASGIYFYCLKTSDHVLSKKMLLVK